MHLTSWPPSALMWRRTRSLCWSISALHCFVAERRRRWRGVHDVREQHGRRHAVYERVAGPGHERLHRVDDLVGIVVKEDLVPTGHQGKPGTRDRLAMYRPNEGGTIRLSSRWTTSVGAVTAGSSVADVVVTVHPEERDGLVAAGRLELEVPGLLGPGQGPVSRDLPLAPVLPVAVLQAVQGLVAEPDRVVVGLTQARPAVAHDEALHRVPGGVDGGDGGAVVHAEEEGLRHPGRADHRLEVSHEVVNGRHGRLVDGVRIAHPPLVVGDQPGEAGHSPEGPGWCGLVPGERRGERPTHEYEDGWPGPGALVGQVDAVALGELDGGRREHRGYPLATLDRGSIPEVLHPALTER